MTTNNGSDEIDTIITDSAILFLHDNPNCKGVSGPEIEQQFKNFLRRITPIIQAETLENFEHELDARSHPQEKPRPGFSYGLEYAATLAFRKASRLREGR